jgi:hypothetical protein
MPQPMPRTFGSAGDAIDVAADQTARLERRYLPAIEAQQAAMKPATSLSEAEIAAFEKELAHRPKYIDLHEVGEENSLKAIARRRASML